MKLYEVNNQLINSLLNVWLDSVCATHLFLSVSEVNKIKEYVPHPLLCIVSFLCVRLAFKTLFCDSKNTLNNTMFNVA